MNESNLVTIAQLETERDILRSALITLVARCEQINFVAAETGKELEQARAAIERSDKGADK